MKYFVDLEFAGVPYYLGLDIAASSFDHWATHMKLLAQFEQVHVKLSGMVTEANWDTWKTEDLKPYVDFCLEYFGPQRLMFGSDWPVCLVAGQYDQVVEALKEAQKKPTKQTS